MSQLVASLSLTPLFLATWKNKVLEDHLSSFRTISEVVVVKDWETQQSWDFGFNTFTNPEHASDAMRAMNEESLDSCHICADHAGKSAPGNQRGAFGARGCSYSRGSGNQRYGSDRYDSRPGKYGYGYGQSRDYSGRTQDGYGCYSGEN
ncbi:Putative RNA-binding protein 3 [Tupaia chinensis]|uniref:Putative RNA-binding protein 3 n=1 Tax=Tupaia chinensis TaxID=246437 RepID=L9KQ13_TUPCH|nr:Putative RNA-binding protein 3 [Tupaia chinensis]